VAGYFRRRMRSAWCTFLFSAVALSACVKDDSPDIPVAEINQVVDHAYMERALVPMPALVRALGIGTGPWAGIGANTCATIDSITGDTAGFPGAGPVTVHLHFPDTGCTDIDYHERAGQLSITLSHLPTAPGALVKIHSMDLRDGEFRYRFWITDSITGADSLRMRVDSSWIYRAGDWGRRLRGDAAYAMTAGQADVDPLDDAWSITHDFAGGDRYGVPYTTHTDEPLEYRIDCPWITKGRETLDPDNYDPRTLQYGDGGCDAQLDFEAQGQSFGLTIP
jgi:hypothetical protein